MISETRMPTDSDFAEITIADKLKLSLVMAKSYARPLFVVLAAGFVIMKCFDFTFFQYFGLDALKELETPEQLLKFFTENSRPIIGYYLAIIIFSTYFTICLASLALAYIDSDEPVNVLAAVIKPLFRSLHILTWLVLWLMFCGLCGFLASILLFVPFLGPLALIAGLTILIMASYFASFHIAANLESFGPLVTVKNSLIAAWYGALPWLIVILASLALWLPGFIVSGIIQAVLGGGIGFWTAVLIDSIYNIFVSMFLLFLSALTFKQTKGVVNRFMPADDS